MSSQNTEATLAIVLQDWCGAEYLAQPFRPHLGELGYDPSLPTNVNLRRLLASIGFEFSDVFGTNAFPFVKNGPMSARLELSALQNAIERYLLPQLTIVGPKAAVLLGKTVSNAVRTVAGLPRELSLADAIATPFEVDGISFGTVAHTGGKIHLHRGWEQSVADWRSIGAFVS